MMIKSTMPPNWLVFQDAPEIKNGLIINVNAFQVIISPKENAFFVTLMKSLTPLYKNVFQTVEIMLTTFHPKESVSVKMDSTEF